MVFLLNLQFKQQDLKKGFHYFNNSVQDKISRLKGIGGLHDIFEIESKVGI